MLSYHITARSKNIKQLDSPGVGFHSHHSFKVDFFSRGWLHLAMNPGGEFLPQLHPGVVTNSIPNDLKIITIPLTFIERLLQLRGTTYLFYITKWNFRSQTMSNQTPSSANHKASWWCSTTPCEALLSSARVRCFLVLCFNNAHLILEPCKKPIQLYGFWPQSERKASHNVNKYSHQWYK